MQLNKVRIYVELFSSEMRLGFFGLNARGWEGRQIDRFGRFCEHGRSTRRFRATLGPDVRGGPRLAKCPKIPSLEFADF